MNLTDNEIRSLQEALDDEYRAWATYDQVIRDFGAVRPFSNIREAEARHIKALLTLFAHYGLPSPENHWLGKIEHFASLKEACEAGIAAEIANGAMYDRLIAENQRPDILRVLRNLQEASQQRHLPAFKLCAQRSGGAETGRGVRHRRRGGNGI